MIQFIISSMILILGLVFTQMKHPLTMGMILLIQTFFITLMVGMTHKTFWFSYILFLIFLGGMLVLFIYVITLSSNEMFSTSNKLMLMFTLTLTFIIMLSLTIDLNYLSTTINYETNLFNNWSMYMNENMMNLNKIYNFPTNLITFLMINYLFLTLVIAVKITNFFYGPLRPSF